MTNGINIQGRLRLFKNGVLIADHANQVTFLGSQALMQGFLGYTGYDLLTFEAGTGGAVPSTSDTSLEVSTYADVLASMAVTGSTSMEVTFEIRSGTTTTQDFTEFGLFCSNGDMFARWCDGVTYHYVSTDNLEGVWTFTFTL